MSQNFDFEKHIACDDVHTCFWCRLSGDFGVLQEGNLAALDRFLDVRGHFLRSDVIHQIRQFFPGETQGRQHNDASFTGKKTHMDAIQRVKYDTLI